MKKPYDPSVELTKLNDEFEYIDRIYKEAVAAFEAKHDSELKALDEMRENRNAKLDDVTRKAREEAQEIDIREHKWFKIGGFSVQKKWSDYYDAERLHALLKEKQLLDKALEDKIIKVTISTAKFEAVKAWLTEKKVVEDFEVCEDGKELTPAVTAPKPIAGFATEFKEK